MPGLPARRIEAVRHADTLDPVGVIEMPSPEQEAMAERLAEAEFQLRYGSPDQAAALVAMVMEQMIDMAGAE